ncbi:MAG TPA: 2-hydroxyacid dehydrogenase, partial [Chloroflexota bacterium]|nr:2-hydroxyacid dehydrogenase [Chloroflexota bacterium]
MRILLIPTVGDDVLAIGRAMLPEGMTLTTGDLKEGGEALAKKVKEADAIIGFIGRLPPEVWEVAPGRIKLIHTLSAGYDEIEIDRARATGIPVCTNGGANAISVAEHTIMLMLAAFRRLPDMVATTRAGKWRTVMGESRYYEIAGKTVGIVGLGKIGQEVVKRLQGWSTTNIYYDVFRRSAEQEAALHVTYVDIDELFARSDIVTLHAPSTPETKHVVNSARLAMMKATSILVNCARGDLVDEKALLDALNEKRILIAALDTLSQEPPPADHPLLHHPNTIVTPHTAGPTWDSWPRRWANAYENLARVSRGEAPLW